MIRRQQRGDRLHDDLFFVVGRHDDGDGRTVAGVINRVPLAPLLDDRQRADEQQPADAEGDAGQEEPADQLDDEVDQVEGGPVGHRLPLRACVDERHHLVARLAEQVRDADELEAALAQLTDEQRQRGDGLGAVAARIMQQDDVAGGVRVGRASHHRVNDLVHAGPLPVF